MALDNHESKDQIPNIFSIQHFCLHDGPGIRSMVFFKGCPLRCVWCQNPESWSPQPEIAFKKHRCLNCGTCVSICPEKVINSAGHRDKKRCKRCFSCVDNCQAEALTRFGQFLSAESIVEQLRPEFPFYQNSGGGVTFSGGEPTLFPAFAAELAARLYRENVHIALETCGQFTMQEPIPPAMELVYGDTASENEELKGSVWSLFFQIDLLIYDIKIFDSDDHRKFCGTDNSRIKNNFIRLAEFSLGDNNLTLWPRMPIIPAITDKRDNLLNWADFLNKNGLRDLTLVPFHKLGESKRLWLSMNPCLAIEKLTDESLNTTKQIFTQAGITCYAPGEEDWPERERCQPSRD